MDLKYYGGDFLIEPVGGKRGLVLRRQQAITNFTL